MSSRSEQSASADAAELEERGRRFNELMRRLAAQPVALTDLPPEAVERARADTAGWDLMHRHKRPLYPQLLRLKNVHPNAWQRALLGEGMAGAGALLAMADLATAWAIVVLPVAVAVLVKGHDLLAGLLATPTTHLLVVGEDAYRLTTGQLSQLRRLNPPREPDAPR